MTGARSLELEAPNSGDHDGADSSSLLISETQIKNRIEIKWILRLRAGEGAFNEEMKGTERCDESGRGKRQERRAAGATGCGSEGLLERRAAGAKGCWSEGLLERERRGRHGKRRERR